MHDEKQTRYYILNYFSEKQIEVKLFINSASTLVLQGSEEFGSSHPSKHFLQNFKQRGLYYIKKLRKPYNGQLQFR